MKQNISVNLHNRFDLEIRDAKTGKLKQKVQAENIILNQAWAKILPTTLDYNAKDWFANIAYGTGTGTIAATRTALFTPLSVKAATEAVWSSSPSEGWYSLRQKIVLLETEHNGAVLTEVGISNSILCTHALLKDMNGNQVAITKVNTDIITIYATVYVKIPAFDKDAAIDFIRERPSENPLICILLGCYIGTGSNRMMQLPTYFELYNGESASLLLQVLGTVTFDVANKKYSVYARIPASLANTNGIDTVRITSYSYNSYYPTYIPTALLHFPGATHTQATIIEQIGTGDGTTTAFATAFPLVRTGVIIKVDGVVASPTVLTGLPRVKNIRNYLKRLGTTGYGENPQVCNYPAMTGPDAMILENPFYIGYGIDNIVCSYATIYTSNDMQTWTQAYTTTGATQTYSVAAEHKQKRYWKIVKSGTNNWNIAEMNCNAMNALKNVVFAAAPATGAVITAEYNTEIAAKDIDHVLDITVTLQLGEYTP